MQSAVRFLTIAPGKDPNAEVNAFLQKVSGWELVSVAFQVLPNATYIALALKTINGAGIKMSELDATEFVQQVR